MNFREQLRERNCPVCGSCDQSKILHRANFDENKLDDFAFASRKLPELMHLNLAQCPACSLIYASPALSPEFLAEAYEQAAYDTTEEAYYAAKTYAALLPSIVGALPAAESALEIGTGNGAFLIELKRAGFRNVCGVEPSMAASSQARTEVREHIRPGMFNVQDFEPASIDLLACFQTMEHLENPRDFCESAFRLLKPGGALYLVVHNYHSWVTSILGQKSPIFDVEHLQLFSEPSLRYLLEDCGFGNIEIRAIRNRYPLSYWLRLAPIPKFFKRTFIQVLNATRLSRIAVSLNIGNLAAIGYKAPGTPT